jgi:hypothetical protein
MGGAVLRAARHDRLRDGQWLEDAFAVVIVRRSTPGVDGESQQDEEAGRRQHHVGAVEPS